MAALRYAKEVAMCRSPLPIIAKDKAPRTSVGSGEAPLPLGQHTLPILEMSAADLYRQGLPRDVTGM
jgi:hypothetical protein